MSFDSYRSIFYIERCAKVRSRPYECSYVPPSTPGTSIAQSSKLSSSTSSAL